MSLNIKQEKAHELAARLARLTGESLTTAVVRSLEERIEREERKARKGRSAVEILAFARRFAARIPPEMKTVNHADLLYGEDGLPK